MTGPGMCGNWPTSWNVPRFWRKGASSCLRIYRKISWLRPVGAPRPHSRPPLLHLPSCPRRAPSTPLQAYLQAYPQLRYRPPSKVRGRPSRETRQLLVPLPRNTLWPPSSDDTSSKSCNAATGTKSTRHACSVSVGVRSIVCWINTDCVTLAVPGTRHQSPAVSFQGTNRTQLIPRRPPVDRLHNHRSSPSSREALGDRWKLFFRRSLLRRQASARTILRQVEVHNPPLETVHGINLFTPAIRGDT